MADKIIVKKVDEVFDRIICDPAIAMELSEYFSFRVPGFQYMPKYKLGIWDGTIRFFNIHKKLLYRGLKEELITFCVDRSYLLENETEDQYDFSINDAIKFVKSLNLPEHINHRDYQIQSFVDCIKAKRATLISPTASGKSFIIYVITRFLGLKTLIICPTVNLVNQTKKFFQEYGYNKEIHIIHSGKEKFNDDATVFISTWQSIYKMDKNWFNSFGVIFVDEAHHAKAKSLISVMEKATKVIYRFGFTGTLDDIKSNELTIKGLFGPIIKIISMSELMEKGFVVPLKIKAIMLEYNDSLKKLASSFKYNDEIEFLISNKHRNDFIFNLANSLEGNTLVLFRYIEKHGKILKNLFNRSKKNVFYASGEVDADTREEIRQIISKEKNCIFLASEGTFSTGADMPSIKNIIFASPSKGRIKVLQSIGRGLRLHESKDKCYLFDISDNLSWKKKINFTLKHFAIRIKIYASEGFEYTITKFKMKD